MTRGRPARVWRSATARRLLQLTGATAVDHAISVLGSQTMIGVGCPPTDLDELQDRLGVTDCRRQDDLVVSGGLRKTGTTYTILLAPGLSRARRRFTVAHELAHI